MGIDFVIISGVLGNDVPVIGFYICGEIGSIDKNKEKLQAAWFHNETVILWVLGER